MRPELKVAVVEARGISEGATGRNGGLMWPSLNAPWPITVQQFGEATARALYDFERHAFAQVTGFVRDNGLQDELQFSLFPEGGYTLCSSKEEWEAELQDLAAQRAMGVEPFAVPLTPADLKRRLGGSAQGFVGGLMQRQVAGITAVRLSHALLRAAAAVEPAAALTVLEHTRVTGLTWAGDGYHVTLQPTDEGSLVRAAHQGRGAAPAPAALRCTQVVHCTNGYNRLLPRLNESGWLVPVRNQVAVTAPLPNTHPLPRAAFYARMGYVYFSRRHDGRVVIGGFRDITPHMELGTTDDSYAGLDPVVSRALRSYLPATFPHLFAPAPPLPPPAPQRSAPLVHALVAPAAASGPLVTQACAASSEQEQTAARTHSALSLPHTVVYEREWSGILGFTADRWPLVGLLPPELAAAPIPTSYCPIRMRPPANRGCDTRAGVASDSGMVTCGDAGGALLPGEYVAMGFSGHGMTRAYTCALNTALLLLGRPREPSFPEAVFHPERVLRGPVAAAAGRSVGVSLPAAPPSKL